MIVDRKLEPRNRFSGLTIVRQSVLHSQLHLRPSLKFLWITAVDAPLGYGRTKKRRPRHQTGCRTPGGLFASGSAVGALRICADLAIGIKAAIHNAKVIALVLKSISCSAYPKLKRVSAGALVFNDVKYAQVALWQSLNAKGG